MTFRNFGAGFGPSNHQQQFLNRGFSSPWRLDQPLQTANHEYLEETAPFDHPIDDTQTLMTDRTSAAQASAVILLLSVVAICRAAGSFNPMAACFALCRSRFRL
jgi:hypothetical protein